MMASRMLDVIKIGKTKYPRPHDFQIAYGTAGFRGKSILLKHVMYRMGLLAAVRSRVTNAAIGLMITASHNPEPDNGVKLIDPHGEMLDKDWEKTADILVDATDDDIYDVLETVSKTSSGDSKPLVFVGRDTRESGTELLKAVITGVEVMDGRIVDYSIVPTPTLHFAVATYNRTGDFELADEKHYIKKLTEPFNTLLKSKDSVASKNYVPQIFFDGANGVGAKELKKLMPELKDNLNIDMYNDGNGSLNYKCGADFVKIEQCAPVGVPQEKLARCVSVDGDADRVVYFYFDEKMKFHLLDGDKISTLIACYIIELLRELKLNISIAVIQTAYANGSSTEYIQNVLRVPVVCVPTGVKHLHEAASNFDVGIYFEANGHGTVLFKKQIEDCVKKTNSKLGLIIDMINQTVGDALSDMLLVESILYLKGWSIQDWDNMYEDLPCEQMKVTVPDRTIFKTTDAERKCTCPAQLQEFIDETVSRHPKARAFVRPSGTEDVVRVYAEASSADDAHKIALMIKNFIVCLVKPRRDQNDSEDTSQDED